MASRRWHLWWWLLALATACWAGDNAASHSGTKTKARTVRTEAAAPAVHGAAAGEPVDRSGLDGGQEWIWSDLMAGNARFVAGQPRLRDWPAARVELLPGQRPRAIVLGCADSRVPPEAVFDQGLGDLFVVRTAGNVADRIALGSMEYAVEHLHVPLLVVLGHRKCGAVTAAAGGEPMPTANLTAIMDRIAPAVARYRATAAGEQLVNLAIEGNVDQSARDILTNSPILTEAAAAGRLAVVRAVYEMESGRVVRRP